jgi:hypothetical protein
MHVQVGYIAMFELIQFNKMCLRYKVIPKYAKVKVQGNTVARTKSKTKAQVLRIGNEIKYLYKKKQQLNVTQTYSLTYIAMITCFYM